MVLTEKEIERRVRDSYELPNNVLDAVREPLVTVRTSTFQHGPYIKECIEGVLMQRTSFPFEFIIGEDFSTDGTREIVFEYAKKYPDIIRVVTADYNVGGKANGRRCIKLSRGRYISACEGDDFWTDPHKLQKQVDFLEQHKDYVGVYTNYSVSDINGQVIRERAYGKERPQYYDRVSILESGLPMTLTTIYRNLPDVFQKAQRSVIGAVNGDQVIAAFMAQEGRIGYIDDVTAVRRLGSGTFSTKSRERQLLDQVKTFELMLPHFNRANEQEALFFRVHKLYLDLACHSLVKGRLNKALHYHRLRLKYVSDYPQSLIIAFLKYVKEGAVKRIRYSK